MVDRDALYPINVISSIFGKTLVLYPYWLTFLYFLTNLGPISVNNVLFFPILDKPRSYITAILFFTPPNVANLGFWNIVPTIAL